MLAVGRGSVKDSSQTFVNIVFLFSENYQSRRTGTRLGKGCNM